MLGILYAWSGDPSFGVLNLVSYRRAWYPLLPLTARRDAELAFVMASILLSRVIRYIPDAIDHPRRFVKLPSTILYLYLIEVIKLYSLLTIFNVSLRRHSHHLLPLSNLVHS